MEQNEIAVNQAAPLAKTDDVADMFGNEQPVLIDVAPPQISILREAQMFEMPNGNKTESITGHLLYWHNANQFYATAFDDRKPEDSLMPTCLSADGIKACVSDEEGYAQQSNFCAECKMNEYGSDLKGGKGKACQNTIRMALLLDGEVVPVLLKAPPSSLGKKDSLKCWLVNAPNESNAAGCGGAYQVIKVKLSLVKKDFGTLSASALVLETVRVLDKGTEEDMAAIMNLVQVSKAFKQSYIGDVAQHMTNEGNPTATDISDMVEAPVVGDEDDAVPADDDII
jgi:hypothetical protein